MKPAAIRGLVLIVVGLAALAYQGVTYTSREKVLDIGPIHATAAREKKWCRFRRCSGPSRLSAALSLIAGVRKGA